MAVTYSVQVQAFSREKPNNNKWVEIASGFSSRKDAAFWVNVNRGIYFSPFDNVSICRGG